MPTIQCPHCKHEARVPSLDKIGGKNVKCPSCNQTFYVESQPSEAPAAAPNVSAFRGPVPEFSPPQTPSARAPSRRQPSESFFSPLTYDPNGLTSGQRYPNLLRYIALSETVIAILFKIVMVLIVIGFLGSEVRALFLIGELGILQVFVLMVSIAGVAILAGLALWFWFIFYMAITEFVRVVIDIENNTRG